MSTFFNLFSLELQRTVSTIKAGPIGYLVGTAFMVGVYFVLEKGSFMGYIPAEAPRGTFFLVYLAWMLCFGAVMDVVGGLCTDITSGVFQRAVQSPFGLDRILAARLLVSLVMSIPSFAVVALAVAYAGSPIAVFTPTAVGIFATLLVQVFGVTCAVAALAISRKSVTTAYGSTMALSAALSFVPFERVLGELAFLVPLAGPLAALKIPPSSTMAPLLGVASVVTVLAGLMLFRWTLARQKRMSTLLFV